MSSSILLWDVAAAGVLLALLRRTPISLGESGPLVLTIVRALPSLAIIAVLMTTGDWRLLPLFWLICFAPVALALRNLAWCTPVVTDDEAPMNKLRAISVAAAVVAIFAAAIRSFNRPYGGWDALAMWNLKARFLFFGVDDGSWTRMFDPDASVAHPDYPLLLPTTVYRLWLTLGEPSQWVPAVFSIVVLTMTIVLLRAAVKACTSHLVADASVLVLLSTTFFVQHAASQFADNFLALLILAASVVLRQLIIAGNQVNFGLNLLYGVLLGLAAATKNEGLLVTTVFVMVYAASLVMRRNMSVTEHIRALIYVATGWTLMIYPHLLMRYGFDVSNDLVTGQSVEHILSTLSWERIALLFWLVIPIIAEFIALPCITGIGVWLLLRMHLRPVFTRESLLVIAAPLLVLSGYLAVLWLTPHDLGFHVTTSLERLLVHIWAALIFALGTLFSGQRTHAQRCPQGRL